MGLGPLRVVGLVGWGGFWVGGLGGGSERLRVMIGELDLVDLAVVPVDKAYYHCFQSTII